MVRSKQVKVTGAVLALLLIVSSALIACTGPVGSAGPSGPRGSAGSPGPPGEAVVSPTASITVTPSTIKPAVRFKSLEVVGSGFVPGEIVEIYLLKAVPVVEGGEKLDACFDTSCPVNDQGAFIAKASFSLLQSLEEGAYSVIAEGDKGSMATYPLLVKEAAE